MKTKKCCACKKRRLVKFFHKHKNRPDGLQTRCIDCKREYDHNYHKKHKDKQRVRNKIWQQKRKQWLIDYKSKHRCKYCGENDYLALDFHHIDDNKEFNISKHICNKSLDIIKKEMAKCEIVCANCHRKIHGGRTLKPL